MPLRFSTLFHLDTWTRALPSMAPKPSKIVHSSPGYQANAQLESAFFTKLPLELRQLIYRYVLGGARFHMGWSSKELVIKRCMFQSLECYRCPESTSPVLQLKPLMFLRTCRQLYAESVNFLYSANTFTFESLIAFDVFTSSIPLQFRNTMRCLYIYCIVDREILSLTDLAMWKKSCNTIADMRGLRELHIVLQKFGHSFASDSNILDPIRVIRRVRDFELKLTWTARYDWGDAPLQLIRERPGRAVFYG